MEKVLFLGSDIHEVPGEKPSELAAKSVSKLFPNFKNCKIVSIQDQKKFNHLSNEIVIPQIVKNKKIRKPIIGILLPLYLGLLRLLGHKKLLTFWTADSYYHFLLFIYLKIIRYDIYFTIISGYDKNYHSLRYCDKIICQSEKMKDGIKRIFPTKEVILIYPGVDLEIFRPKHKENSIIIPSMPFEVKEFWTRNIHEIINFLKKNKSIKSIFVTRSDEVYSYLKAQKITNCKIINKKLSDRELAEFLSKTSLMVLTYNFQPDMPLSAIEGMASGCAILCSEGMGISEVVKKNNCGLIENEINLENVRKIFSDKKLNKNSRKTAEIFFDENKMVEDYTNLLSN